MMKLFIGMIVGSVITLFAAGGQAAAELVTQNIVTLARESASDPASLMSVILLWGGLTYGVGAIKRRRESRRVSRYAYLLR